MFTQSYIEKIKSKKIFALEGNIGAGKTTILNIIAKHFKDIEIVDEPVKQWQNISGNNLLNLFYSDPQRWGFSFEFYSMLTKTQGLLKALDSEKPIIITERSLLSDKIFIDLSKELGKLNKMEYHMLMNTYDFYLQNIYPPLTGIIYLDTPVEQCVKRINKRNRLEESNIKKTYLEAIKKKLDELVKSSSMLIIKIDGIYDCERDYSMVCDNISKYWHPIKTPKIENHREEN